MLRVSVPLQSTQKAAASFHRAAQQQQQQPQRRPSLPCCAATPRSNASTPRSGFSSARPQVDNSSRSTLVCAAQSSPSSMSTEVATLGGGCFWCLDACYRQMRGVLKVESGYTGGQVENPTYQQICTGTTGHAEVVQITFDPSIVTYTELLEVLFTIHDPTTKNRQGNDVGTQYRSVIYYHSDEQKAAAEAVMKRVTDEKWYGNKIPVLSMFTGDSPLVTELSPLPTYYPAEKYHQDYFNQNPTQGYCMAVVAPKVAKLRGKFMAKLLK